MHTVLFYFINLICIWHYLFVIQSRGFCNLFFWLQSFIEDNSLHLEQIYPHPLPQYVASNNPKLCESCFPKHEIMNIVPEPAPYKCS